jgi:hypothetical protein
MRKIAVPFVVAPPSGVRVRTRLRLDAADERVLRAVGEHLGRLAGADLTVRCRLGGGDDQRADRKRGTHGGGVQPLGGGDHPHFQ